MTTPTQDDLRDAETATYRARENVTRAKHTLDDSILSAARRAASSDFQPHLPTTQLKMSVLRQHYTRIAQRDPAVIKAKADLAAAENAFRDANRKRVEIGFALRDQNTGVQE